MGIIDKASKAFNLRDACLGVNMNDMEQAVHNALATPFPPALKGNVLAWWDAGYQRDVVLGLNQLIVNGDFSYGTSGWSPIGCTASVSGGNLILTAGAATAAYAGRSISGTFSVGDVVAVKYRARAKSSDCSVLRVYVTDGTGSISALSQNNPVINQWYEGVAIGTLSNTTLNVYFRHDYANTTISVGKEIEIDFCLLFNVSSSFVKGNEPTATEFAAILAADGNQYWEGTRNVKVNPDGKYYAYDASGNGRPAKLYNMAYNAASGPQAGPPKHWKGDGVDDWMGRAESGFIAQDADFSYCMVVSPSADNTGIWGGYGFTTSFELARNVAVYWETNRFGASINDRVSGNAESVVIMSTSASTFYSVIGTYTHADKKMRIYVNGIAGAPSAAIANGHTAINYMRTYRTTAGTIYSAHRQGIDGWFNKALSLQEVKDIHNKLASRFGLTPVA